MLFLCRRWSGGDKYLDEKKITKLCSVEMFFPVFTLPITPVRNLTHSKYLYYFYFTVIQIHSSVMNKWSENEQIIFTG